MPYYVKNSELLKEVISSKENGKLSDRAVAMFILIATESNKKLKYKDPMDREDCISAALEDLIRYWDRFDPAKSNNAFAFFSQIAKHGFAKGWKKLHNPEMGQMLSISADNIYNF
jgi:DNA-directed RNA polymerase specialized sigma subunit